MPPTFTRDIQRTLLWNLSRGHVRYAYGTFTLCSAPFQVDFCFTKLGNRQSKPHISPRFPKGIRFVLVHFRSLLITESL